MGQGTPWAIKGDEVVVIWGANPKHSGLGVHAHTEQHTAGIEHWTTGRCLHFLPLSLNLPLWSPPKPVKSCKHSILSKNYIFLSGFWTGHWSPHVLCTGEIIPGQLLHVGSNLAVTHNGYIEIYLWLQRRSLCLHHLCPSGWTSAGSHCSRHVTLSWPPRWHRLDAGLVCSLLSFKTQERASCAAATHPVLNTALTWRIPLWLPVCQDMFCPFWFSCKGGEPSYIRESTAAFLYQVQSARIQFPCHLHPKEFLHFF